MVGLPGPKFIITGLVLILFGWWVNQSLIPTIYPEMVGTPAAGLWSVAASIVLWLFLWCLFWRHDAKVSQEAQK